MINIFYLLWLRNGQPRLCRPSLTTIHHIGVLLHLWGNRQEVDWLGAVIKIKKWQTTNNIIENMRIHYLDLKVTTVPTNISIMVMHMMVKRTTRLSTMLHRWTLFNIGIILEISYVRRSVRLFWRKRAKRCIATANAKITRKVSDRFILYLFRPRQLSSEKYHSKFNLNRPLWGIYLSLSLDL